MRATFRTPWWSRPEPWGLLLRLMLMPLGACWDLFGYYWLSHQWVYHGQIPLEQYGGYLAIWPMFYLHAAWLWLIKPLLGSGDPWGEGLNPSLSLTPFWVEPDALQAFYLQPTIPLSLALLKCPYVFVELWLIRLLLQHAATSLTARKRLAWFLWLNPVSLYTISLYGAWDVIPVALLVLGVILRHRAPRWAGVSAGVAVILKIFPMLVLPFVVVGPREHRRARVTFGLAVCSTILVWLLVGQQFGIQVASTIAGLSQWDMLTSWDIPLRAPRGVYLYDHLYLFVVGYVLLVFKAIQSGARGFEDVARYATAALLFFYSVSFFHVQYFFWVLPFLAVLMAHHPRLLGLFAIQAACLAVYSLQWERALTTYLVAPLNPEFFFAQPSPFERLARFTDPGRVIGLAHSVFAGVSLWLMYEVLGRHPKAAS